MKLLRPRQQTGLGLTKHEREIVNLLANGETTKELAWTLGVSPRTVQKHLQHIYARLGVNGRIAAVLMVVRSGISQG